MYEKKALYRKIDKFHTNDVQIDPFYWVYPFRFVPFILYYRNLTYSILKKANTKVASLLTISGGKIHFATTQPFEIIIKFVLDFRG